ncbi:hypothetical protein BJX62DRAFT_243749 [Aspergillus germanicus]
MVRPSCSVRVHSDPWILGISLSGHHPSHALDKSQNPRPQKLVESTISHQLSTQKEGQKIGMVKSPPMIIVIVGGVVGGMSAAARARRLDENASITVLERGSYVSYANCGVPDALGNVVHPDSALVLQTEPALENRLPYDKLILAQGAQSFRPPIPGIHGENVLTLQTILDLAVVKYYIAQLGCRTAAIIGGGFIGLEAAENLRQLGLEVSVVEQNMTAPFDSDIAELLHAELRGGKRATHSPVHLVLEGRPDVPASLVIVAVGVKARVSLAQAAGLAIGNRACLLKG